MLHIESSLDHYDNMLLSAHFFFKSIKLFQMFVLNLSCLMNAAFPFFSWRFIYVDVFWFQPASHLIIILSMTQLKTLPWSIDSQASVHCNQCALLSIKAPSLCVVPLKIGILLCVVNNIIN